MKGTTVVLVSKDKKILLELRDGRRNWYPNRWCIPGGTIEEGEKPLDCAVREMQEEFDIVLDPAKCSFLTSYMHDGIGPDHVFVCTVGDTNINVNEAQDAEWLTLDEIKQIPLAFEQDKILPIVEDYLSPNIIHPSSRA